MIRPIPVAAAALFCVTPALGAHWNVDAARSRLGFTVQWSGEPFNATFKSWKADINFDPADLAHSHVVVTVDLGSEASDTPDNDDGLKGPQGFSIAQFPTARFDTASFKHGAGNAYMATGTLSLHGMTRPVTLPFTLAIAGDTAHVTGRAEVLRTDFGLGQGEWAAATPIAHEVTINLDLTATKAR
jgi:polyisoprenoid-binding protein YceI